MREDTLGSYTMSFRVLTISLWLREYGILLSKLFHCTTDDWLIRYDLIESLNIILAQSAANLRVAISLWILIEAFKLVIKAVGS